MDGTTTGSPSERRTLRQRSDDTLFHTLVKALLLAAGLVVFIWFLYEIRRAVMLFLLALILMMVLNAPVTWLERKRLSRGIATLLVFVGLLILSGLLGWLVVPRLAEEIPTLVEELPQVVEEQLQQLSELLGGAPEIDRQLSQLVAWVERALGEAWRIAGTAAAGLLLSLFVVAMVLYMVSDPRPMLQWYVRSMPPRLREPAVRAFHRSSRMVVGWVLANAIMGGIKATAAFIFLNLMDVPGALVWSILALFAALIPRIGFYLMSIPPVVVALTVSPTTALWTLLFFWALSEFLGNFVAPRVQGEIMELHAAYLLFMALAMGLAFGLLGVLVSAPVAGFIKVFYDEFYLANQPEDPELEKHVEQMIEGSIEGARSMKKQVRG
jgi:putative permease